MTQPESDPKRGEKTYYARLTPDELAHARDKPFSDPECGKYLADFGALLSMLPPAPKRILDLGCGTGWTSILLARAGHDVVGVDLSPEAIRIAGEAAAEWGVSTVEFVAADYEELQFADAFDVVLFYDALHHAEDEAAAIAAAHRALTAEGVLIAFEPGTGHSGTRGAAHAMARFQVHEKDMPPSHIWRIGRRVGFRRKLFLPAPHDVARAVYRRDFFRARGRFELLLERCWGYWRAVTKVQRASRGGVTLLWK